MWCFISCICCIKLSRINKFSLNLNHWGKLRSSRAITKLTAHFTWGLMYGLVICKQRKYGQCPYWDQVSWNNTNSKNQVWVLSCYNRGPVTHQSSLPHIAPCHWEHLDDLELTHNKIFKNKPNNMYSNSGHVIVFDFICRKLLSKIWFTLVSVMDIAPIVHMYCAKGIP